MEFKFIVTKLGSPIAGFADKNMAENFASLIGGNISNDDYSIADVEAYVIAHPQIAMNDTIARIKAVKVLYNLDLLSAKKVYESLYKS